MERLRERTVIERPAAEVWAFCSAMENLRHLLPDFEGLEVDGGRAHWRIPAPAGAAEAEVVVLEAAEAERITWKGSYGEVQHDGEMTLRPVPVSVSGGEATEVRIELRTRSGGSLAGRRTAAVAEARPPEARDSASLLRAALDRLKRAVEGPRHPSKGELPEPDTVAEASEESFPASDPPAWTAVHAGRSKDGPAGSR